MGCYRAVDSNDPETYIAAAIAVLSRYPIKIIEAVSSPVTGLPSKLKWLPSIAEIKEACEEYDRFNARIRQAERQRQEQLAERARFEAENDRSNRKSYAEIQADFAKVGFRFGKRAYQPVDPKEVMQKYNISQEQWDAIPSPEQHNETMKKFGQGK